MAEPAHNDLRSTLLRYRAPPSKNNRRRILVVAAVGICSLLVVFLVVGDRQRSGGERRRFGSTGGAESVQSEIDVVTTTTKTSSPLDSQHMYRPVSASIGTMGYPFGTYRNQSDAANMYQYHPILRTMFETIDRELGIGMLEDTFEISCEVPLRLGEIKQEDMVYDKARCLGSGNGKDQLSAIGSRMELLVLFSFQLQFLENSR